MKMIRKTKTCPSMAIIHDAIVSLGGGEYVLGFLHEAFPDADIITSVSSDPVVRALHLKNIHQTWAQAFPFFRTYPRLVQLFAPQIWGTVNIHAYDIILSHGGFYCSEMIDTVKKPKTFHARYEILPALNVFTQSDPHWIDRLCYPTIYPFIRNGSIRAMHSVNSLACVSTYTQKKIREIYGEHANVIAPPIHQYACVGSSNRDTYTYIGRIDKEKNVDLIVQTFNKNGLPLTIAGIGNDLNRLKHIAHPNITFTGFLETSMKQILLNRTIAFIHAMIEDAFPLAPLEALSAGVPVICPNGGGLLDIIKDGVNGYVYLDPTPISLESALQKNIRTPIDRNRCIESVRQLTKSNFIRLMKEWIYTSYDQFQKPKNRNYS